MKRKIICVISLVIIFCIISVEIFYLDKTELKRYVPETQTLAYVHFNTVYVNGEKVDMYNIEENQEIDIQQIFCVCDNKVYFSYQYLINSVLHWCVAYVVTDTLTLYVIVDEVFDYDSKDKYSITLDNDYYERNGYYYDDKIVITDYKKLIEVDVKDNSYSVLSYSNYPKFKMNTVWEIKSNEKIVFKNSDKKIIFDKIFATAKSVVAKKIISYDGREIWNGTNSLEYFFDSIQVIDEKIYVICRVLDFHGGTYAILFYFDFNEQTFEYAGYCFTGDIILESEFYIVPRTPS